MNRLNKNLLASVFLFMTILFVGCSKDELNVSSEELNHQDFAGISAFNAIEGTENLQLLVDDKVINRTDENFQTGGYLNPRTIFPGDRKLSLISPKGHIYYKGEIKTVASKFYSIFFYGQVNATIMIAEDEFIKPANGKQKVRVVNLVSEGNLKLSYNYLNSQESYDFKERVLAYKEYASNEKITFNLSSTDGKYEAVKFEFDGDDQSINTIVFYTDINKETSKREIKYKIIENK